MSSDKCRVEEGRCDSGGCGEEEGEVGREKFTSIQSGAERCLQRDTGRAEAGAGNR